MTTLTIIHAPGDAALAARIRQNVTAAGIETYDAVQAGDQPVTVLLLSPEALANANVQQQMVEALENHQHILPVIVKPVALPHLIDHLQPVDFSETYNAEALLERIKTLSTPGAPPPITVLTPSVRASNRRTAYYMLGIIAVVFVAALYMVGAEGLQAPVEEYNTINTIEAGTRDVWIRPTLEAFQPRTTEDAANFPATLDAIRPRVLQPFLELTATAMIERQR